MGKLGKRSMGMARFSVRQTVLVVFTILGLSMAASVTRAAEKTVGAAVAYSLAKAVNDYAQRSLINCAIFCYSVKGSWNAAHRKPDPEHSLLVHVFDSEGKPVQNAMIHVGRIGSPGEIPEEEIVNRVEEKTVDAAEEDFMFYFCQRPTSSKGMATVLIPSKKNEGLLVKVEAEGYRPQTAAWQHGEIEKMPLPREHTFHLVPSKTIGGLVIDESGEPIAGAKITLTFELSHEFGDPDPDPSEWDFDPEHSVRTDAQGRWTFAKMSARLDSCKIMINHDRYVEVSLDHSAVVAHREEFLARKAVFTMHKGLVVQGTVTDSEGKPLASAHVSLHPRSWMAGQNSTTADTTTDSRGRYRFANCLPAQQPCPNTIAVTARGMACQHRDIEIQPDSPAVDFQMSKSQPLIIRVLDKEGNPLPKVNVDINSWPIDSKYHILDASQTDSDGRWRLTTVPEGEISLSISKEGFGKVTEKITPDGQEHEVVLKPAIQISGNVIDAVTKKPVSNVRIVTKHKDSGNRLGIIHYPSLTTQGEHFELTFNEAAAGDGITWQLRVEAIGYATQLAPIDVKDGSHTFNIELSPGKSLHGVVKHPDGTPVPGARVFVATSSESVRLDRSSFFGRADDSTLTAADGRFEMSLPLEPYIVGAIHTFGGAEITAEELDSRSEIVLQPWARVEGTVHLPKDLPENSQTTVSLTMKYAKEENNEQDKRPHIDWSCSADLDRSGRFAFDRVLPGKCSVEPWEGYWIAYEGESCPLWRERIVEAVAGQTLHIEFGGAKGRTIEGVAAIPTVNGRKFSRVSGGGAFIFQRPLAPLPAEMTDKSPEERKQWEARWLESAAGKAADDAGQNQMFEVQSDGRFKAQNVVPGVYKLGIYLYENGEQPEDSEEIAWYLQEITIPADGESAEKPLNLGTIAMNADRLYNGATAPDFEFTTADGQSHRLSDYRGKKVVLYFSKKWEDGSSFSDPAIIQSNYLKTYGRPLVWINLSLDPRPRPDLKIVPSDDFQVLQGTLSPAQKILEAYDIRHEQRGFITIAEDGKVIRK